MSPARKKSSRTQITLSLSTSHVHSMFPFFHVILHCIGYIRVVSSNDLVHPNQSQMALSIPITHTTSFISTWDLLRLSNNMAFKASRALMAVRAVSVPRSVPVAKSLTTSVRPTTVTFRPAQVSVSLAQRYKSTERSAWAKQPIISYEELKPITQQPNDVCLSRLNKARASL